jgi:hypothetical protein
MFCLFSATLSICLAVVWISYGTGPLLLVVDLLILLLEVLHGHGRIWPCPCTLTCRIRAVPIHGQGHIRPCPWTGTGLNSGLSLYMDRAE